MLRLKAKLDLRAAGHRNGKPRRFNILAYNGGKMLVEGFELPVVLDLAGLEAPGSFPILLDHQATTETTLGSVDKIQNDGKCLALAGLVTGVSTQVQNVLAAADAGQQWQASVGVHCSDCFDVPAGQVVKINGRDHRGPFTHVRRGLLYETSVLPAGADSTTKVNLAARRAAKVLRGSVMPDFETWVRENFGTEVASLTPEIIMLLQERYDALANSTSTGEVAEVPETVAAGAAFGVRASAAAESRRIAACQRIAARHPNILATAIERGWSAETTELHVLRAGARNAAPDNSRRYGTPMEADRNVLSASLLLRCSGGEKVALKAYGERVVEAARRQRVTNLVDLAKESLRAAGHDPDAHGSRDQMLRASFSTTSLPNILADTVGRSLVSAYEETTSDWRSFCYVASAEDFRQQLGIRPAAIGNLEQLAPGGSITHGVIKEEATYAWRVNTFAKMLKVTREDVVNDDLGFIDQLSPMLGTSAGRSLLDLIWETIMAGEASNFFSVANANLLSSSSILGVASLQTAIGMMRAQMDSQGHNLNIQPTALAVPPLEEFRARGLLNSALLVGSTTDDELQPSGNPVYNVVPTLVVEPRLSNTKFTGNSTADWYLFGPPNARAVTVGFLQGNQTPTIEMENAPFDQLGTQMRVVFDYGCSLSDPKAAFKANAA
ncbi:Mu-like prophage major head subunit gpT [Caulifigura coniformis]|uniref:Mu-like prophage major head subunit gpT n=1 Tax=Caulifigura coniformis TaxID=2527983 RepID=A0A517SL92_9PLAN|nr:Mu-like prophage major head subunit gpT family protein [Caulifigura coniformis]QDT56893.1 Mu-like prophage major head subunit gpT [Caulifigura coniformis]